MEQFFHSTPRGDFRPVLGHLFARPGPVRIAVGFLSRKGVRDLASTFDVRRLEWLVFGHPGPEDLAAASELEIVLGKGRVFLHPGYGTPREAMFGVHAYRRPMLHSKIYLNDGDDREYSAFIGSVNVTGYAIEGRNAEAGVLMVGPKSDPQYGRINSALNGIKAQAIAFDSAAIPTYLDWYRCILRGLEEELDRGEEVLAPTVSVIALAAEFPGGRVPIANECLYFEVPRDYVESFPKIDQDVDVWLYPVAGGAPTVLAARTTTTSLTGKGASARGTTGGRKGTFDEIDWIIRDLANPLVEYYNKKPSPPPTSPQQVVVSFLGSTADAYGMANEAELSYSAVRTRRPYPSLTLREADSQETDRGIERRPEGADSSGLFSDDPGEFEADGGELWHPILSLMDQPKNKLQPLNFGSLRLLSDSASQSYQSYKLETRLPLVILKRVRPSKSRLRGWTEKGLSHQSKL